MSENQFDEVTLFGPKAATGDIFPYTITDENLEFDYKEGLKHGIAIFDVGTSVLKLVPGTSLEMNILGLFKAALGATSTFMSSPPSPQEGLLDARYGSLLKDVEKEAGLSGGDPEAEVDFSGMPTTVFDRFVANRNVSAADNEDWKSGNLSIQAEVHYPKTHQDWLSDTYDDHGFAGLAQHSVTKRGGRWLKRIWAWNDGPLTGSPAPQP